MRTSALSRGSDLAGQLLRLDDRVGAGDGVTAGALEVEAAAVLLRVPVAPAERLPASAHEPREPHLLAARRAPARQRLLLRRRLGRGGRGRHGGFRYGDFSSRSQQTHAGGGRRRHRWLSRRGGTDGAGLGGHRGSGGSHDGIERRGGGGGAWTVRHGAAVLLVADGAHAEGRRAPEETAARGAHRRGASATYLLLRHPARGVCGS